MSIRAAILGMTTAGLFVGGCHKAPPADTGSSWSGAGLGLPTADWIRDNAFSPPFRLSRAPLFADQVRAAVRDQGKKLQRCYVTELKEDPGLYGELVVMIRIEASGRVKEAWTDYTTLSGPALEPCILDVFRTLTLPAPPHPDFTVRYPLVFTSKQIPEEIMGTLEARYHLERERGEVEKAARQKPVDDRAPW